MILLTLLVMLCCLVLVAVGAVVPGAMWMFLVGLGLFALVAAWGLTLRRDHPGRDGHLPAR